MPEASESYDYIVVGAGSSGCIVAAELAADPRASVLLLEAGQPAEDHPETLRAAGYKQAFINDRLMWDRVSEPQPDCGGNTIFLGSGRGVGGSGSINAMVYTRGQAGDYAAWGLGAEGWDFAALQPDFEAVERRLSIRRLPPTRFTEACIAAAEEQGFARKEDLNDGRLCGYLGYEWMNMGDTERHSSYVAFLRPRLGRDNLRLVTSALARRVLVEGGRAAGVEYQQGEGRRPVVRTARARREVILCAGALETPKLLLLSGIGPQEELARHGIPVTAPLPGVGQNLQDHPNVGVFFLGRRPTDCTWAQLYGFHRASPDSAASEGRVPAGEADSCYVFYSARSSFREGVLRLLPLMILPLFLYRVGWLRRLLRGLLGALFLLPPVRWLVGRMYGVIVILGRPRSRGVLRLRSRRPEDPARIDPRYLSDPEDLETLVRGVRRARSVAAARALAEWGNRELIPGARCASDAALRRFVRRNVITTYHYAGTCRMGLGEDAVVDPRLRVRGVAGLRVADAAVMPTVPVAALNATSMVIGYRAARFILEESERAHERGDQAHRDPDRGRRLPGA